MNEGIDVVVPVYRDVELTRACLESVLALSGPRLGRLIIVDDRSPEPGMGALLTTLRARDARVRLLENEENLGFVGACNRGLALRSGDVVVLNSDTRVTAGWLDELAAALDDPLVAAACPVSNNAALCSIPRWCEGTPEAELEAAGLHTENAPRFTELPTGVGFCLLMRGALLELFGGFDPAYGRGYNEENDWCQRVRAAGFKVVRANHALVFHRGEVSFQGERASRDVTNARRLVARYPNYLAENAAFEHSLDAHLAALSQRSAGPSVRVRVDASGLRAEREPEAALAAQWLEASLGADPEVSRIDERGPGAVEVLHVLGFPPPAALRDLLRVHAHLVHSHFDLRLLEGRPEGLAWAEVEQLRASATVLWQSATVVVGSQREAQAIADFLGGAGRAQVLVEPALFTPLERGQGGSDVVALSPRFTRAVASRLIEAWRRAPAARGDLLLASSPRLAAARLEAPRLHLVDVRDPLARDGVLARARVLVLPPGEPPDGPDAARVLGAGGRVVAIDQDPVQAPERLFAEHPASKPMHPDAGRWAPVYRRAVAGGAARSPQRRRLSELAGLFHR